MYQILIQIQYLISFYMYTVHYRGELLRNALYCCLSHDDDLRLWQDVLATCPFFLSSLPAIQCMPSAKRG